MWGAVMDVGGWLRSLSLGKYEAAFLENGIGEAVLPHLTVEDLKEIGVATVGDRRMLLAAITALASATAADRPGPQPPPAPPKGPQVSAERRPITVMFCDLVGSTALASRLDAEDWRSLVNAYLDEATGAVNGLGGHVLKRLGDGLMALFGYPQAQENDAERAVRSALAIQRALGEMNARNAAKGAPQISARIGLDSGPVVVDPTGEVFGEAPNIAARVQGLADSGTVLVTANVQRQTAGLFVAEDKGAHELKGVKAPVTLYRIMRASGGRRAGARTLTPLVGREEELDILRRRWERALKGEGQLALVVGEPGIGKSRLVEEFRLRLGETPHTFVEWSSSQLLQNTPLHPVAEWGRQRFGADLPGEKCLADLEDTLSLIGLDPAEYAPLLAPLVDIPLPEERAPKLAPEELRHRQLAAMTSWVLAGARSQPAAVVFEDLHWADPTTLDLMQALAERGQLAPLLILATTRPEFRPAWSLRSHHSVISLAPLDRAQVARMVGEISLRHALPKDVVDRVSERTGGVPLFVEEVTRLLLERSDAGGAQAIPPTLQQSLAARLDRLGEAREVAQIGAVLGRGFTYALLRAVGEIAHPDLQSALDRLAGADLLFVEGAGAQATYRFKHALIQDAAYESLLKSRRQALHHRAAEILCDDPECAAAEPELIAHHFTEAGLDDLAMEWWRRAGELAIGRSANLEAINHLSHGLQILKTLPESRQRDEQELVFQVALLAPHWASKGFASPASRQVAVRAEELCQRVGGHLSEHIRALWGLAVFHLVCGEPRTGFAAGERCLQLAEQLQDRSLLGHAQFLMGNLLFWFAELVRARGHLERGIALYDPERARFEAARFGFQDHSAACYSFLGRVLWHLGYPDQAKVVAERSLATANDLGHPFTVANALSWAAALHQLCGDVGRARELSEKDLAFSTEQVIPFFAAHAMVLLGWALVMQGRGEEGVVQLDAGLAAYRATGSETELPHWLGLMVEACCSTGRIEEGLRVVAEALDISERTGAVYYEADLHRLEGELRLHAEPADAPAAEMCFRRAMDIARKQQAKSWELRAATSYARLMREQGRAREAHDLLAPIYGWFTEGLDTLDLIEAKALLDRLTPRRGANCC
jgi:class 3 adenylate cyclase/predicted ATPase